MIFLLKHAYRCLRKFPRICSIIFASPLSLPPCMLSSITESVKTLSSQFTDLPEAEFYNFAKQRELPGALLSPILKTA